MKKSLLFKVTMPIYDTTLFSLLHKQDLTALAGLLPFPSRSPTVQFPFLSLLSLASSPCSGAGWKQEWDWDKDGMGMRRAGEGGKRERRKAERER